MTDKLVVRDLCKVFGPGPQQAIRLLDQGLDKDAIFARTRATVGVRDAGFAIREGGRTVGAGVVAKIID